MITRRKILLAGAGGIASAGLAGCGPGSSSGSGSASGESPSKKGKPVTISYGADESQVAELYLPEGDGKVPVAVVIHGGFWMSSYGRELATPLAEDLAAQGIAGYAIEYRRVGNGGGWPTTFEDVAAAIDKLADQPRLDLTKVVAVGHSAGGHLAVWAASRPGLPPGAPGAAPRVVLTGAVSQAGVLDLVNAYDEKVGGDAVPAFVGTTPAKDRARYQLASPYERLPLKVPVALVHGTRDGQVPIEQSRRYRDAAIKAGDQVKLTELEHVGHFELIDPQDKAWLTCRSEAQRLLT
ncbi:alpha/beta fold hydrolase [Streptomyces sp. SID13031]|uniref:alpha/beta hydrolase family protein n=1 Tax=Streptomyces sp. SID13031 TaxID=2706046 RepID=UPI0013CBA5EC|nr:alpha/beta fold hydrolase [Streptomyces sp. SID13031]NEA34695.1 alpha/beta fold hydrolase [Streptomyces sp. SID13031]